MSWATVVKLVRRLEGEGFIREAGVDPSPRTQGPDSTLYDLVGDYPLAVGIDVEYHRTRAEIVDLRGTVHARAEFSTPEFDTVDQVVSHCGKVSDKVLADHSELNEKVVGFGVAMPLFLIHERENLFALAQRRFQKYTEDPVVVVDDVARAYALAKQHEIVSPASFATVTIRSGIGLGLSVGGHLYRGDDNYAGQLGHMVVRPENSTVCPRCGNSGCLEMNVNEQLLTVDLLKRARSGDSKAAIAVEAQADALAHAVSFVVLVMNIETIYVAGHFAGNGEYFVSLVESAMSRYVMPLLPYAIHAEELADDRFPVGAAFLVLAQYCNYDSHY